MSLSACRGFRAVPSPAGRCAGAGSERCGGLVLAAKGEQVREMDLGRPWWCLVFRRMAIRNRVTMRHRNGDRQGNRTRIPCSRNTQFEQRLMEYPGLAAVPALGLFAQGQLRQDAAQDYAEGKGDRRAGTNQPGAVAEKICNRGQIKRKPGAKAAFGTDWPKTTAQPPPEALPTATAPARRRSTRRSFHNCTPRRHP
jgi:hypothetical protein